MPTPDAFTRALKSLSMPELQALWAVMSADDKLTPRQRLAEHLKLEWFRSLPPFEMSRVWLAAMRDGTVDIPPDFLPAPDGAGLPTDGQHDTDNRGGRGPPA